MIQKTSIDYQGQPFVWDPVHAHIKPELDTIIARSVRRIVGNPKIKDVIVGHERVKLRWMEPDGKGGLKPKYEEKP